MFESLESRTQKSSWTTENERWICLLLKRPRCNFTDLYRFTDEIHIKSVITAIFSRQLFAVPVFSVYHFFSCLRDRWFEHWGNWGILSRVGCFETGWLEALPCFKVVAPNSFSSFEIFLPSHKVNSSLFLQKWEKSFPFMLAKLVFKWVSKYIKQSIAQAETIFRKCLLGTVLPWAWHSARWSHDRWSFCWISWWLVQYFLFWNWNWEACSTCCLCRFGTNCCWWSQNWNISSLVPSRTAHHW